MPRWLCDELLASARINLHGNDLVFWSKTSKVNSISASFIRDRLYESLADAFKVEDDPESKGFDEVERERRNINFHSFRHFFLA